MVSQQQHNPMQTNSNFGAITYYTSGFKSFKWVGLSVAFLYAFLVYLSALMPKLFAQLWVKLLALPSQFAERIPLAKTVYLYVVETLCHRLPASLINQVFLKSTLFGTSSLAFLQAL